MTIDWNDLIMNETTEAVAMRIAVIYNTVEDMPVNMILKKLVEYFEDDGTEADERRFIQLRTCFENCDCGIYDNVEVAWMGEFNYTKVVTPSRKLAVLLTWSSMKSPIVDLWSCIIQQHEESQLFVLVDFRNNANEQAHCELWDLHHIIDVS